MIVKPALFPALLLTGFAFAAEPGLVKQGATAGNDGWKLTYSAIAKPPLAPGQQISLRTDASHTDLPGRPPVFHRFFADPANHTFFGYDVVVENAGKTGPAALRFRKLSLRGDQLPKEYGAAAYRVAAIPEFPVETFQSGQKIALDVLRNPRSGLRVVDYIQVSRDVPAPPAASAGSVAKILGNRGAPVCIELFSDFQCPGCKGFHDAVLPLILRDYVTSGKAYVLSHELPLPMHPHAREAANYATAAAQVGKYQAVADALFRDQQSWAASGKVWDTVASVLSGDEQQRVQALAKDPAILAQVQQDVDLAIAARLGQTPTVVISRGAKRYNFPGPGLENYSLLKSLIDGLLK